MSEARSIPMAPPRLDDVPPQGLAGDVGHLLGRVRRLVGARSATLRLPQEIEGARLFHSGAALPQASGAQGSDETVFCRTALGLRRLLVVPDAAEDVRFRDDALVAGGTGVRFYAGLPLFLDPAGPIGLLCVFGERPRQLTAGEARRLVDLGTELTALVARRRDAARIADLAGALATQARLIGEQAQALAHSRKIFERAAAAARIGLWECDLADEALHWSGGVYDMFDLPRGAVPDRQETLACYSPESVVALQELRAKAIAERSGFQLDAEIVTPKGHRRWIRVTATVECERGVPMRIFGMKQDITEEKLLTDRTRYLAEFDVMTGLANRSRFQARLCDAAADKAGCRPIGGLILVDLDGFKQINDTYGHALGDECLKVAAARLAGVCVGTELVARIGGDEFAVLLAPGAGGAMEALASGIVEALGRPVKHQGRSFGLGASVGVAPAEGATPEVLFRRADAALYAAKAAGRNTFRRFDPSMLRD